MFDDECMTIAPCRHQHPVRHLAAIILDGFPRQRRHFTIRFLHDQIGRGKIPVPALTAREGHVKPSQPQRQRCDSRMGRNFVG